MAIAQKKTIRRTSAPVALKVKKGGQKVVSDALVKHGAANLVPKMHVKRGDMVVLISGPRKDGKYEPDLKKRLDERNSYKGQIGKVSSVSPATGKITIEGVNMITRATKAKGMNTQAGLIRKEGPLFASRVMLYCSECKKPTRIKHKVENGKKTRICRHCSQGFGT